MNWLRNFIFKNPDPRRHEEERKHGNTFSKFNEDFKTDYDFVLRRSNNGPRYEAERVTVILLSNTRPIRDLAAMEIRNVESSGEAEKKAGAKSIPREGQDHADGAKGEAGAESTAGEGQDHAKEARQEADTQLVEILQDTKEIEEILAQTSRVIEEMLQTVARVESGASSASVDQEESGSSEGRDPSDRESNDGEKCEAVQG